VLFRVQKSIFGRAPRSDHVAYCGKGHGSGSEASLNAPPEVEVKWSALRNPNDCSHSDAPRATAAFHFTAATLPIGSSFVASVRWGRVLLQTDDVAIESSTAQESIRMVPSRRTDLTYNSRSRKMCCQLTNRPTQPLGLLIRKVTTAADRA